MSRYKTETESVSRKTQIQLHPKGEMFIRILTIVSLCECDYLQINAGHQISNQFISFGLSLPLTLTIFTPKCCAHEKCLYKQNSC